jgi:hypothetical protein
LQRSQTTILYSPSTYNLQIGGFSNRYWSGDVIDLRVWTSVLSSSDLSLVMMGQQTTSFSSLVLWFPFNETFSTLPQAIFDYSNSHKTMSWTTSPLHVSPCNGLSISPSPSPHLFCFLFFGFPSLA